MLTTILSIIGLLCVLSHFVPPFLAKYILPIVNLKKKYGAKWALVTGGSSGIGEAMVEKLAGMGLNVVIVALGDDFLGEMHDKVTKKYPDVEFRVVGTDLATPGYMDVIKKATDDILINVVFSNAGYGDNRLLLDCEPDAQLRNVECLVLSGLNISQHFYKRMVMEMDDVKGCIIFTSSMASYFPSPLMSVYSGSKAFVASHADVLFIEASEDGIDVLCVHPGHTATRFSDNADMDLLSMLSDSPFSQTSEQVVDIALASVGRFSHIDSGPMAWSTRFLGAVFGGGSGAMLLSLSKRFMPDFARHRKHSGMLRKRQANMKKKE